MDTLSKIKHFKTLGLELIKLSENLHNHKFSEHILKAQSNNTWFDDTSIKFALSEIGQSLTQENLTEWLNKYNIPIPREPKTIGLILAGNIPLVGFHDILCVVFSGNKVLAKLSSKDKDLYQILLSVLIEIEPEYNKLIQFTDQQLKYIDAIIATGSDNSARYFEYYFKKYPSIIRKNRNSIGILTGDENETDYKNIGKDIFTYFGLGCRNVSFLLIPENFDFIPLMKSLEEYQVAVEHTKYANNYDYQRAILLMNNIAIYDNGSLILKNENNLSSPIGVINYIHYKNKNEVNEFVKQHKYSIQCIVSKTKWDFTTYSFGEAQKPKLWDYADNMDTLQFLLDLN